MFILKWMITAHWELMHLVSRHCLCHGPLDVQLRLCKSCRHMLWTATAQQPPRQAQGSGNCKSAALLPIAAGSPCRLRTFGTAQLLQSFLKVTELCNKALYTHTHPFSAHTWFQTQCVCWKTPDSTHLVFNLEGCYFHPLWWFYILFLL